MNIKFLNKLLLFIPVALLLSFGCSSKQDEKAGTFASEADSAEAVRVIELDYRKISRSIIYPANLMAFREVHLAPASPGRVEKIHVEAGTPVSKGQLLVEMDRTQLQQAQVQLASVEKDYRRLDTLRKAGSVSQQQFDQIKTQYELALSNVGFLKENTILVAPFSGTVSGKYVEDGEMFSGAPNTPAGKAALLSVVQTTQLKVLVNVSESYYPNVNPGMPVIINSDVMPEEDFRGNITRIYPTLNPATRTFTIEVTVPNHDGRLRPGMFARARLDLEQVEVFVVPAIAVLKLQGSNERYVFLEENGRARRVTVEPGERFDDMVEIVSDEIQPGDNLIIAGQARLLDGVAVTIN
ncbi:MAG: efflux RND transporter periplasmic adaptor subunit [Bacteroidales bacterium]